MASKPVLRVFDKRLDGTVWSLHWDRVDNVWKINDPDKKRLEAESFEYWSTTDIPRWARAHGVHLRYTEEDVM